MIVGLIIGVFYLLSDLFYWAKWVASIIALWLWRRFYRKRFDLYDFEAENEPEKLGVLVPKEERILESPVSEEHLQNATDEIFFYGVNSKCESLLVRVTREPNDEASAWIYLKLKDGRWFELQEMAGHQRNYGGKCSSFTCGGLQVYYLAPMRRWRIVYCGMLKNGKEKGENNEKELFVKFTFLWTASSEVYDPLYELDIRKTADAMAKAKWASPIPPVEKLSELFNFYCQSGVISGTVSLEDEPDVEMYLFGERIRHLGNSAFSVGCKFKHIVGMTPASGLVIHLGKASVPDTFHNLHFGFIVHPDSFNRAIQDAFIISRMSENAKFEEDLTVMFEAGNKYELRGNFIRDGVRFTTGQGWNGPLELVGIEFEVNGMKGSGFMISGEMLELPERKCQRIPPVLPTNRPLTVYFADEISHFTDLSGGKGSSLGILTKFSSETKAEFIVPKGIVVTTEAYNEFLTSEIRDKIEELKDIAYGNMKGSIQEACKIVVSAVERTYLPDKITKEIEEKLLKIFDGNINQHKVAVRSSATGEDTDQMSAAGQMDTFLGVQGLKEIFTAVKKCWASQFAYIATEYKRQNGQIMNSPMAVVIQEMAECEAAGVLFTCDPVTNNPSVIVISGNYGLGESVVSGSEEPDTVVLKKLPMNEVEIKAVTVGLKQHKIVMTDRPLTVYFADEISHFTDLSGGKGSSLGILTKFSSETKAEFIVPKGIVVTTEAYNEFLTSEIRDKIEELKDIAYGNMKGSIQEACKIVVSAVERTYLPDKITKEIEEKLLKIFDGNINQHKVAVRSSATGEDTDQMSAAGQMDTFLGVQGLKEIFTAVKKCWASQFAYIATEYKRQNGQIMNSPMAVVIQEMAECEAAGVLFTCDPVTNNPSVIVISGNYGLGESVVSGSEEPDTVVLKKLPMNEVEIKAVTVGLKQHKIVMTDPKSEDDEATVVTEDVQEDKRNECCISRDMAVKLGKLSLKIEEYYKSPRDIEWGIKDDSIYILQSRPITTGAATTDHEIKHEFDSPLRCERDFFTISNTGEAMPGAGSPLGIDVLHRYFAAIFQKDAMREGENDSFLKHKYFSSGMTSFYNHMTLAVLDMVTRGGNPDSIGAQSMMIGIFGRILDDPELNVMAKYREAEKKKMGLRLFLRLLQNLFFFGKGMEELKEETFAYRVPAESGKTSKEIFDLQMHSCSHFTKPCLNHIVCSGMSSMWNMCMLSTLGNAKGCIDTDVYSDFAKLLATSSNVESADIPSAIQKLAQWIVKDIESEKFKSMTAEEALEWLETSTGLSGIKFREFIKRHGHRCLKELDMYSVPWNMDPKTLITLLQNMAGSCCDVKEKNAGDLSTIFPQLTVPMSLKTKLLLRFILPNCRKGVRGREAAKSIVIKSTDNIRRGFRHLSKAMVAEGYLPDTDLLYFLTLDEIRCLLETRNPRLIARANHRRRLHPVLDSYLFPDIWKGLAIPLNENQDEEIEYVADLTMKGIPVSQGTVKGYARVALTLQEASHVKKGEILITYGTDIGWSPYFPVLAGVVTELGGLISHGAVVSREYGLPCIVGLHGATKQFVTGDYVLLDGNKGILQRLTPPEQ